MRHFGLAIGFVVLLVSVSFSQEVYRYDNVSKEFTKTITTVKEEMMSVASLNDLLEKKKVRLTLLQSIKENELSEQEIGLILELMGRKCREVSISPFSTTALTFEKYIVMEIEKMKVEVEKLEAVISVAK
jgi:hypothetical protein